MFGQVAIGLTEAPVKGAVLQLKTIEGDNLVNSTLGLGLPRVNLTDEAQLYPMFDTNYDKTIEDPKHIGLVVYNLNTIGKLSPGAYVWNGYRWLEAKVEGGLPPYCIERAKISYPSSEIRYIVFPESMPSFRASYTGSPIDLKWQRKDETSKKWIDLPDSRSVSYEPDLEGTYRFAIRDCFTDAWVFSSEIILEIVARPNESEYSTNTSGNIYIFGSNCFDTRENYELVTVDGQNGKESSRQITNIRPLPVGEFRYDLVKPSGTTLTNIIWSIEDPKGFLRGYSIEGDINDKAVLHFIDWQSLLVLTEDGRLATNTDIQQTVTLTAYFLNGSTKQKVSMIVKVQDFFCCDGLIIQNGAFDYADGTGGDWSRGFKNHSGSGSSTLLSGKNLTNFPQSYTTLGNIAQVYNQTAVSDICWYKKDVSPATSITPNYVTWATAITGCASGDAADGDYDGWYLPNVMEWNMLMQILPDDPRPGYTGKYGNKAIFGGSPDATGISAAANLAYYSSDEYSSTYAIIIHNAARGNRYSGRKLAQSGDTFNLLRARCVRRF